jgi:transposase
LREAFSPGAKVQHVAARYDISCGLIYQWRRTALCRAQAAFAPAVIDDAAEPTAVPVASIEAEAAIVLETDRCLVITDFRINAAGLSRGRVEGDAMIPAGARVWIAMGHTRYASRDAEPCGDGAAALPEGPIGRRSLGLSGSQRHACEDHLARWDRHVALRQGSRDGRFIWPSVKDGMVSLTSSQLACLPDRIDWRNPQYSWCPQSAG